MPVLETGALSPLGDGVICNHDRVLCPPRLFSQGIEPAFICLEFLCIAVSIVLVVPEGPKPRALPVAPHPDNYLRKLHLGRTFSWVALHNTRHLKLVCVANRTSHCEILSFIHSSGSPNECPSRLRGTLSALPLTALLTASLPT